MGQHPLRPLDLHTAMPRDEPDPDIATRIARLENLRFDVYGIIAQRRSAAAAAAAAAAAVRKHSTEGGASNDEAR